MPAPKLDERTLQVLLEQARGLAGVYTPDWVGAAEGDDPGARLLELAARLMELLIQRLNQVPEKNFLGFLDMVGVEQFAGRSAEGPVTFLLSEKEQLGGEIPAGTQVATTQTESSDAQIFETRDAFFATPARIKRLINVVPEADAYEDLPRVDLPPSAVILDDTSRGRTILHAGAATLVDLDHILFLESETLFGRDEEIDLTLTFDFVQGESHFIESNLTWQRYSAEEKAWVPLNASYTSPGVVLFPSMPSADAVEVDGVKGRWIACQFTAAIPDAASRPVIGDIKGTINDGGGATVALPDVALFNGTKLDLSKPLEPFGARPRYGDALYLSSSVAFSPEVESVTLRFQVRPITDAEIEAMLQGLPAGEVHSITTLVQWQCRDDAEQWRTLAEFEHELTATGTAGSPTVRRTLSRDGNLTSVEDGTFFGVATGVTLVEFKVSIPEEIGSGEVGGVEGSWIRALLKSVDPYGRDGYVVSTTAGPVFVGPSFVSPAIESAELEYEYRSSVFPIDQIRTLNSFWFDDPPAGLPFQPFLPVEDQPAGGEAGALSAEPALYVGFNKPLGNVFVSLFANLQEAVPSPTTPVETGAPQLVWEYLDADAEWRPLDTQDDTDHLTTSGPIGFVGPLESAQLELFPELFNEDEATELYWIRARLLSGHYDHPPQLLDLLPNTVWSTQTVTDREERRIGSAKGEQSQELLMPASPILAGELWVREPEIPGADDLERLRVDFERQASERGAPREFTSEELLDLVEPEDAEGDREVWVRWLGVPNFLTAEPRSRHYTLDRVRARLTFGDGVAGLIPPVGRNNLVMRGFQTGGGEDANAVAQPLAIRELKSSLSFVDKVFNVRGALGGADPWSLSGTMSFGPKTIQNRGRAVTTEDYVWMVLEQFGQVARVRCLATRAPLTGGGLGVQPGAVTLIVVPKSEERTPQPTNGLLRKIGEFLRERTLGNIVDEIHVIGPDFTSVDVQASAVPEDPRNSSQVRRRIERNLEAFFHPLTGGENGSGWAFGRSVPRSEIYAVIEGTKGVDHVASVSFIDDADASYLAVPESSLVVSGSHLIEVA